MDTQDTGAATALDQTLAPDPGATDAGQAAPPVPAAPAPTDTAPAGAGDPSATGSALVDGPADLVEALATALAGRIAQVASANATASTVAPPAPWIAPTPPSLQAAGLDALQIGEALVTHQPVPRAQSRALALMAVAAGVGSLAHLTGQTPAALGPWLDGGALALAFVATAIGDFTGTFRRKT